MRFIIRDKLLADPVISEYVNETNIFSYEIPDTVKMQSGITVYIDMLDIPMPHTYYDGEYHQEEYLVQIDCYAPQTLYTELTKVAEAVQIMFEDDFGWKLRGGIDQFDKELQIFRYGKRFQGIYKIMRSV